MQLNLIRIVQSPLRYVGIAPGQALANARVTPAERERQRLEQWTYIRSRFDGVATSIPPKHHAQ